jgi:hypothetical protein
LTPLRREVARLRQVVRQVGVDPPTVILDDGKVNEAGLKAWYREHGTGLLDLLQPGEDSL